MVFVAAHTNAVGTHIRFDTRLEETSGVVYDVHTGTMVPYYNQDAFYNQRVGESRKPAPYKGDHRTAYDYWRGINAVVVDKPYLLRAHWDNPVDHLTSNYDTVGNQFISYRHGPFGYDPLPSGDFIDELWNEAVTKALLSLKGENSSDIGASLGELGQTVDSLASSVMRGTYFIRSMRRGNWALAAKHLGITPKVFRDTRGKVLADYWLAYSFGWKPLASEMYGLADTICEHVSRNSNFIEGTGTAISSNDVSFTYGNWDVIGSWAARIRAVLKAEITNPGLRLINKTGLTNPASVAWELVPFSFVVDWFVPVGNTLDALTASVGLTWHGGFVSKTIHKAVGIRHKTGYITPWVDCLDGGDYKERMLEFQRVALTGFPYPQFYANRNPYSTTRALNALALVRSLT